MTEQPRVAVFGASGFVGTRVVEALEARGAQVIRLTAPRLRPIPAQDVAEFCHASAELRDHVQASLGGATAIVNAAGIPDASSRDEPRLMAANAACAAILAAGACAHGVQRFVHVSSAAVQGDIDTLDETTQIHPFSAYSRSKVLGEHLVAELGPTESISYRPPGVHGADRRVTRMIHRLASSPLSTTVAPGNGPSPQALIQNVADAVAYLAVCPTAPPPIVIHPWEGITTSGLLRLLGRREPRMLHPALARAGVHMLKRTSRGLPSLEAHRRRIELLWFGQPQASSWLSGAGWTPPVGLDGWDKLFDLLLATPPDRRRNDLVVH
jgi:nucleoside-diphosphate-sugar epimerase